MNELNRLGDLNQVFNNIIEELKSPKPSSERIIEYLNGVRTKEEFQNLTDSKYYDFVGEVFKLNPGFFIENIYEKINTAEMGKYIIEHFSLYDDEQIQYVYEGSILQKDPLKDVKVTIENADLFFTNYRIIAQGKWKAKGGVNTWLPIFLWGVSGKYTRGKTKKGVTGSYSQQELPCYGYQFKTRESEALKKKVDGIKYVVNTAQDISNLSRTQWAKENRLVEITLVDPTDEKINNLFELIRRKPNQILESIRELHEMKLPPKIKQLHFIQKLAVGSYFPSSGKIVSRLQGEDANYFSESDYLKIVKEIYQLDPEFFMTSLYPKLMSVKFAKFQTVKDLKEKIIALIEQLNKES